MRRLLLALLVLCLLAACGGDDPDADVAPTEEAAAPATTASADDPTPTEVAPHQPAGDGLPPDLDEQPGDDAAGDDGTGDDGAAGDAGDAAGAADPGDGPADDSEERGLSDEDKGGAMLGDVGDGPVSGGSSDGGVALLTDVRVGEHEGFDRIVFEFAGNTVPSYRVAPADPPLTASGSGREVEVEGDSFLEVAFSGASGVDLSGGQPVETYTGPDRVDGDDTRTVTQVVQLGDFEGELRWVVGLSQQMPFSVGTLSGPARLVVDVQSL